MVILMSFAEGRRFWAAAVLLSAGLCLSCHGPEPSYWRPDRESVWLYQLSEPVSGPRDGVEVYVLDLFDTPGETVRALRQSGARVVAYFSAGSWEDWRPDAHRYPASVLGSAYEGWPGERWVDIRDLDTLGPILQHRLDLAVSKGFDGVDPDNVDGYANDTGFPLTEQDQLCFCRWLAGEAHRRGLAIGLKNNPEQVAALAPAFDFAVSESCFAEGWCGLWQPFLSAGKPVVAIEYTDEMGEDVFFQTVCAQREERLYPVLCRRELDGWALRCSGI